MAVGNAIAPEGVEYKLLPWGDLIYGTKPQLMALGIAPGMQFPGEPGGPKRRLLVEDPRGFKARIEKSLDGRYLVSIPFPGRSRPGWKWRPYAEGVERLHLWHSDCYRGTADALVAAGLVKREFLPGQPGMRKRTVRIRPDGTPVGESSRRTSDVRSVAGSVRIERTSSARLDVSITVDDDTAERRHKAMQDQDLEWERRMNRLNRPSPLTEESVRLAAPYLRLITGRD